MLHCTCTWCKTVPVMLKGMLNSRTCIFLISFEIKVHARSYGKISKTDQSFSLQKKKKKEKEKKESYWVSCLSKLTRDHMWKHDKWKYISNSRTTVVLEITFEWF